MDEEVGDELQLADDLELPVDLEPEAATDDPDAFADLDLDTDQEPAPDREETELSFAELAVPSMTVLFVFLTAQTTAQSIYDEKKIGSFRRLLAAPIGKGGLLSGKMLPNFLVVLIQVIVIFGVAI